MADVFELFVHNFVHAVTMETQWWTEVVASQDSLIEERSGRRSKPRRSITVHWTGMDKGETQRLLFTLMRLTYQRALRVPVYQDLSVTDGNSTGTAIVCPTTNRRFHAGQRVVIHPGERGESPQFRVIASVTPTQINVTVALTGTLTPGALVYPVLDVDMQLSTDGEGLTDGLFDVEARFLERPENAIPAESTYAGYAGTTQLDAAGTSRYVMPMLPNWTAAVNVGVRRNGGEYDTGYDHVVIPRGPRGQFVITYRYDGFDREECWDLLKFFDAHMGRLIPFFVVNPEVIWTAEVIGTTAVDVVKVGDIDDPTQFASYVSIRMANGDHYVRAITGVSEVGGRYRLGLDPALPGGLVVGDVDEITLAHLCRFDTDELQETWKNNTVSVFNVRVVEVLNEQEVTVLA